MKYIAYYGAWGTSLLCLILTIYKIIAMVININTLYDLLQAKLDVITLIILLLGMVLSAWIVCDMKKRMKDL